MCLDFRIDFRIDKTSKGQLIMADNRKEQECA
jgi:hypothetical protein